MKKRTLRIISASLSVALIGSTLSFAHPGHDHDEPTSNRTIVSGQQQNQAAERLRIDLEAKKQARQTEINDSRAELTQRLEGAKKRACEARQDKLNDLMSKMDTRRESVFERITKVSDAVQQFVADKELSVPEYERLIANVNAAKVLAEATATEQKAVPDLDCSGEQPRADVDDFKQKRADSIDAMKAYRDAVKALAKAVRSVVVTEENAA